MSLRRLIATVNIVLIGALSLASSVSARQFYDVSASHKNHQAISELTNLDVVSGYADGSFRPNDTINRAEAIKLLVETIKPDSVVQSTQNNLHKNLRSIMPFFDISASDWFAPHVALAYQQGVVKGYPNGSFAPNNTLNFAEGLKMIIETYGVDTRRVRFQDHTLLYTKASDWFARYFGYAYNKNIINREKFYHPAQPMTRGDFVEILYRLKTVREQGLDQYVPSDIPSSNEYTITIPTLGLINVDVSFADPHDAQGSLSVLKDGLGHYLSPPGSGKKMVLFGHSSGYDWDTSDFKQILRQIDKLKDGDVIYLNYQEKGFAYQISNREIMPAQQLNKVMNDYGYEEVAMYTCWPPDSVRHRYVVYAGKI